MALHPPGELERRHDRLELGIAGRRFELFGTQGAKQVELPALGFGRAKRTGEIADRRGRDRGAGLADRRPLVGRGEERAAIIARTAVAGRCPD